MNLRPRRRLTFGEYVLRGLIRAGAAFVVTVCVLAQYVSANGRSLP